MRILRFFKCQNRGKQGVKTPKTPSKGTFENSWVVKLKIFRKSTESQIFRKTRNLGFCQREISAPVSLILKFRVAFNKSLKNTSNVGLEVANGWISVEIRSPWNRQNRHPGEYTQVFSIHKALPKMSFSAQKLKVKILQKETSKHRVWTVLSLRKFLI